MNLIKLLLLTSGMFVSCAAVAQAHAFLDHAEPKVGETVSNAPCIVKIWFTRGVVAAGSNIAVFDANGVEVDEKNSKTTPSEIDLITVSLPKLPTGTYKVVWNAVCRDSHHTTGTYSFTVSGT